MDRKLIVLVAVFLFAFSSFASALSSQEDVFDDVSVYRIYPEAAYIGQKVWITIAIENTGESDRTIEIFEKLGDANFDKSGAEAIPTTYGTMYFYNWEINLPAGENTSVSYWIEPKSPGNYVISPSEVTSDEETYRMKSAVIAVSCLIDEACGTGENYLNCPQDCASGAVDGVCDGVSEGICDPDCAVDADNDCISNGGIIPSSNESTASVDDITTADKQSTDSVTEKIDSDFYLGPNVIYIIGIVAIVIIVFFLLKWKK